MWRWLRKKTPFVHGALFELHRGPALLGTIELRAELCDDPWYGGRLTPTPAFSDVAPLFREELRLLDLEAMDAWGAVWAEIENPDLRLVPVGSDTAIPDLLLHIDGDEVRWRC